MNNKGWIKLHRKINENVFLSKDNNAYVVFVRLLTLVSSKGEWAGGRHQLGEITSLNPNTLYKVLKRLEREHLVNIKSNSRYSVISICKWRDYQGSGNSQSNNVVTTREQPGNTLIRIENKELRKPVNKNSKGYKQFLKTKANFKVKSI
jgi:hypothetical protein